jgi:hypothetical protein
MTPDNKKRNESMWTDQTMVPKHTAVGSSGDDLMCKPAPRKLLDLLQNFKILSMRVLQIVRLIDG